MATHHDTAHLQVVSGAEHTIQLQTCGNDVEREREQVYGSSGR